MGSLQTIILTFFLSIVTWNAHSTRALNDAPLELFNFEYIQFELINGLIVLSASVDGQEGNFILDTGSPQLLLNSKVKKADFACVSVDRTMKAKYVDVDHLKIGNFEKHRIEAWATNLSFLEELLDLKISGLIGLDIITESRLWIDYENERIYLLPSSISTLPLNMGNRNTVALDFELSDQGMPVVHLPINQKSMYLAFDTGAGLSVLNHDVLPEAFTTKNNNSQDGDQNIDHFNLRIGHLTIRNLAYISSDLQKFNEETSIKIDGILSVSSLNAQQVLIDYPNSKIYIFWENQSS